MILAVDTHTHIYPFFDLATVFTAALRNLDRNVSASGAKQSETVCPVLCLAERHDCHWFADIVRSGGAKFDGGRIELSDDGKLLRARFDTGRMLYIVPGRQIVSQERLEWLCIGRDAQIPERLPWRDLLARIEGAGAIPVLNWAPGKWWFKRAEHVDEVFAARNPRLALCDTTLRPSCWPRPYKMVQGMRRGLTVLKGSDPLPFSGEEHRVGTYGIMIPGIAEGEPSLESLLTALRSREARQLGRRNSVYDWLMRMSRYYSGSSARC